MGLGVCQHQLQGCCCHLVLLGWLDLCGLWAFRHTTFSPGITCQLSDARLILRVSACISIDCDDVVMAGLTFPVFVLAFICACHGGGRMPATALLLPTAGEWPPLMLAALSWLSPLAVALGTSTQVCRHEGGAGRGSCGGGGDTSYCTLHFLQFSHGFYKFSTLT